MKKSYPFLLDHRPFYFCENSCVLLFSSKIFILIKRRYIYIYIYIRKHQSQKINRIYQSFLFNLFKNDFTIEIGKEDIQLAKPFETVLVLESIGVWNSNIV